MTGFLSGAGAAPALLAADVWPPFPDDVHVRLDVDASPGARRPYCVVFTRQEHAHLSAAALRRQAGPGLVDTWGPFCLPETLPAVRPFLSALLQANTALIESYTTLADAMKAMRPYWARP